MTELLSDLTTPSDAELISSVRGGDVAAYGELFSRHRDAANRLARQLVRGPDADDLVSEAFAKVLTVLQGGGGPDVAFRAYLLTAIRRLHVDKVRAGARTQPSDDMSAYDPGVPFQDTAVAAFESGAAAKAFATLPERWQLVLWHLEVEGQKPADIAPLLGMSPNSVSALAYRAREGLRQAFLTMHLNDISETECRWVNEHLGAYVRKGLSNRDATKVQTHLDQCRRCTAMYLELTEVNSNLAGILAPLLLGGAATGYLASSGAAAGGLGFIGAAFGRVRDVVTTNAGAATAAGVAAGVAAVATAGVLLIPSDNEQVVGAKEPIGVTSPAGPSSAARPSAEATERERASRSADPSPSEESTSEEAESDTLPAIAATPEASTATDAPLPSTETPADQPSDQPAGPDVPGPVESDVSFTSPVTFDGDSVSFSVSGDPLPPTIGLELVSKPEGITFRDSSASCRLTSDTTATCSTGVLARGGSAMQRGMAQAPRSFSDSLPLGIAAEQPDTDVQLVVSVPQGYRDPSDPASNASGFQYKSKKPTPPVPQPQPTPPAQPVAPVPTTPSDPTPPPVTPPTPPVDPPVAPTVDVSLDGTVVDDDGIHLRASATAALPSSVTVTLASDTEGVGLGDAPGCEPAADLRTAVCATSSASTFVTDIPFINLATQPDHVHLAVALSLPEGFTSDDVVTHTSLAADVALALPSEVKAAQPGIHNFDGELVGLPSGYENSVTFRINADGAAFLSSEGCTVEPSDSSLLTCGPTAKPAFSMSTPPGSLDATRVSISVEALTGFRDPSGDNNTDVVMLLPFPPVVDVVLSDLIYTDGKESANLVTARVEGLPVSTTAVQFALAHSDDNGNLPHFIGEDTTPGCTVVPEAKQNDSLLVSCEPSLIKDGVLAVDLGVFHPMGQPEEKVTISVEAISSGEGDDVKGNNSLPVTLK